MTRYLLDTNIISDAIKPIPSASLIAWLEEQSDEDLYISAFTIAEVRRGILNEGRRVEANRTRNLVRRSCRTAGPVPEPNPALR